MIFLLLMVLGEPKMIGDISDLAYMVGEWHGTGWIAQQGGPRQTFTVKEHVQVKAGGSVLAIDGAGKDEQGVLVHDAFGLISKTSDGTLQFQAFKSGQSVGGDMEKTEEGHLVWGFKLPSGQIRYTLDFSTIDVWI